MAQIECNCSDKEVKSIYYFDVSIEDSEYPIPINKSHCVFNVRSEIVEGTDQTFIVMSIPEDGHAEKKILATFKNDTLKALIKKL